MNEYLFSIIKNSVFGEQEIIEGKTERIHFVTAD